MTKVLAQISIAAATTLILASCSGGGGSSAPAPYQDAQIVISGSVADGYLVGAKVCLDANSNSVCDPDETYTTTGANGVYSFTGIPGASLLPILVEVDPTTIDMDTNTAVGAKYTLTKAQGQTTGFISPITTLIANEMLLNSTTLAVAEQAVKTDLGVNASLFDDYVGKTDADSVKIHKIAQWVATNMQTGEANIETSAATQSITLDEATKKALKSEVRKQIRSSLPTMKSSYDASSSSYTVAFDFTDLTSKVSSITSSLNNALTQTQKDSLIFMWNEEKMARDVYNAMYSKYGIKIFANIAKSEQTHMNMVASLITKYGMSVPSDTAGVFGVEEISALYATLIAQGSVSSTEALKVGKLVEETDISDINDRLVGATDEMITIFNSLKDGSYNHLDAFNKQL